VTAVHVSQIRRYEAGTSTPTLDVLRNIALALHTSADTLVFDPDERTPTDDLKLIFEAINDLDPHHKQLAKELLEAITHRAHAHRWQQPAAS
jgi:transcriptional regulator with XRE-family HTH domain